MKTAALTDDAVLLIESGGAVGVSEMVRGVVGAGKGQCNAVGARLCNCGPLSYDLSVCIRGLR